MCREISDHLVDDVGFVRAIRERVREGVDLSRNLYKEY